MHTPEDPHSIKDPRQRSSTERSNKVIRLNISLASSNHRQLSPYGTRQFNRAKHQQTLKLRAGRKPRPTQSKIYCFVLHIACQVNSLMQLTEWTILSTASPK